MLFKRVHPPPANQAGTSLSQRWSPVSSSVVMQTSGGQATYLVVTGHARRDRQQLLFTLTILTHLSLYMGKGQISAPQSANMTLVDVFSVCGLLLN